MPTLKMKVTPKFPARVLGGDGITVTRSGGTYTFEFNSGQFPGTTTNDDATLGNVGERLVSAVEPGAAVAILSNTGTNLASILLTPGDYDVTGKISYLPASGTASTIQQASLSTTSATRDLTAARLSNGWNGPSTANVGLSAVVQSTRFSVSGPTTVYLVGFAIFTVNTMTMYGIIEARRVR